MSGSPHTISQLLGGLKVTVVGANKAQRRIWARDRTVFLKPSQAAAVDSDCAFIVIAADGVDAAIVVARAGSACVVTDRWLTESKRTGHLQPASAHYWPPWVALSTPQVPLPALVPAEATLSPSPKRARLYDESDDARDAEPSMLDTTDAIRAFVLESADPWPRAVQGFPEKEGHVQIVDGVLTARDGARLIELAAGARDPYTGRQGFQWADLNGAMRRDDRKSDRVIVDEPALAEQLFARLRSGLPANKGNWRLVGLNPYLRVLRYWRGDFFYRHPDGEYRCPHTNQRSFLTCLVYLNEGYRGGFTTVYTSAGRALPVTPHAGMALLHDHNLYHEVPELLEGVKYVIRTDVMYERVVSD